MATTKTARAAVKNDINTLKDDLKVLGTEEKARLREKATAAEARLRAKAAEAETRLREEADVLRERARGYYDTARVRGQEYYDEASERIDEAQRYLVERVQERLWHIAAAEHAEAAALVGNARVLGGRRIGWCGRHGETQLRRTAASASRRKIDITGPESA